MTDDARLARTVERLRQAGQPSAMGETAPRQSPVLGKVSQQYSKAGLAEVDPRLVGDGVRRVPTEDVPTSVSGRYTSAVRGRWLLIARRSKELAERSIGKSSGRCTMTPSPRIRQLPADEAAASCSVATGRTLTVSRGYTHLFKQM
jgi:hypothetical protein